MPSENVSVSPSLISLEFAGKLRINPFSISNVTVGLTPSLRLNVSPSANSLAACTTSVGLDISASIMVFMELATSTLDILSLIGTNAVLGLLIGSFWPNSPSTKLDTSVPLVTLTALAPPNASKRFSLSSLRCIWILRADWPIAVSILAATSAPVSVRSNEISVPEPDGTPSTSNSKVTVVPALSSMTKLCCMAPFSRSAFADGATIVNPDSNSKTWSSISKVWPSRIWIPSIATNSVPVVSRSLVLIFWPVFRSPAVSKSILRRRLSTPAKSASETRAWRHVESSWMVPRTSRNVASWMVPSSSTLLVSSRSQSLLLSVAQTRNVSRRYHGSQSGTGFPSWSSGMLAPSSVSDQYVKYKYGLSSAANSLKLNSLLIIEPWAPPMKS